MDGEFHIAPWQSERALLNQRVCKISASDCNVDERFIFYKMSVVLKQIEDETPFVTVKHLSAKRLNQVKLPIPPLPEQSRIVEELDLLSNIIEKKRQQLSELDNLAQSIFYDMFGDPVTNEKGWEVKKIKDFANVKIGPFGSLLHNSDYISGGTPLVNPIHMKNEYIYAEENFTISDEKLKELSSYLLQADDIIMQAFMLNKVHQGVALKGIVSRKIQIVPNIMEVLDR
jgi:type I restriction enzyme S subunit